MCRPRWLPNSYWFLGVLGFWGCFNIFALRLNLSMAIVDMVQGPTAIQNGTQENGDTFAWNEITQGIVLGCYFYGQGPALLPGGRLSEMVSAKWFYGLTSLANALLSLASPYVARAGKGPFIALRVVQGAVAGLAYPVLHTLLSRWVPPSKRAFVSTFVYTGRLVGSAATMGLSGLMIYADLWGGWPSVFYVFGLCGVAWFILWSLLIYDRPLTNGDSENQDRTTSLHKSGPVPWKKIFTSPPMWALCVSHFGNSYGLETLMLLLPTYINQILNYDIQENGMWSSLPFLVDGLTGFTAAYLADLFIRRKYLGVTAVRKVWTAIAYLGAAGCFLAVSFLGEDRVAAVILFLLALGFSGIAAPCVFVVQMDMAPDFAGTLMGISSFFASVAGVLAPYVVGVLTNGQQTLSQWRIAFYIIVAVYVFTTIVFTKFGSAELQPWGLVSLNAENADFKSQKESVEPTAAGWKNRRSNATYFCCNT